MTNYEKIKSMSVDEMAAFMAKTIMENTLKKRKRKGFRYNIKLYFVAREWFNWLESEIED